MAGRAAGRAGGGVLHGRGSSRGALHGSRPNIVVLFTAGVPHHVRIANLMVTLPAGVGSRTARVPPPQRQALNIIHTKSCACNAVYASLLRIASSRRLSLMRVCACLHESHDP